MMFADARACLVALLACALLGCSASYRPVTQRAVQSDELALSLESLELRSNYYGARSALLRLRVKSVPEHTTLLSLAVNDARQPRCKGGVAADELEIAGRRPLRDALR